MILTSYYSNKTGIDNNRNRYCSISVGTPRWKLPYPLAHVKILKPFRVFKKYDNMVDYEREYRKDLDALGVDAIRQAIKEAQGDKENAVLLCYEKDKRECHRYVFAKWWKEHTGEDVEELGESQIAKKEEEPKPIAKPSEGPDAIQLSLFS